MGEFKNEQTIIFFDGVCHLCNSYVDFMISQDKRRHLSFAPLQGKTAELLLSAHDRQSLESIILYQQKKTFYRSTAVIKSLAAIGTPYQVVLLFLLIPRFIRDPLYNLIARNRYKIFGQREFCRLPNQDERAYLLD